MDGLLHMAFEDNIIIMIQQYMNDTLVKAAGIITEFGDATILVGIIGLLYWSLNKKLGKKLVVYLSLVNIINPAIKTVVKRFRPYMLNKDIKCLKPVNNEGDIYDIVSQEYSFPSGHAVNSISVYGSIIKHSRNVLLRLLLALLILLVGISRFSLGVHYPTDVLAGWLVAYLCVSAYDTVEKKLGRNRTYVLLDVLGLLGFLFATTNDYYTGYGLMVGSTLGILFEEKYVNFEGTRKFIPALLRTAGGIAIFLILNSVLKLPFTEEFLNSGTITAFAVRAARYAVVVFLLLGVYPKTFRLFSKKEKQ